MIGTSDQSCWLAEACKILLLLLCLAFQAVVNDLQHIMSCVAWTQSTAHQATCGDAAFLC